MIITIIVVVVFAATNLQYEKDWFVNNYFFLI